MWSIYDGFLFEKDIIVMIIRFCIGLSGTIFMFLFFKKMFSNKMFNSVTNNQTVQFIGRNTLGLYLFQILYLGYIRVLVIIPFHMDVITYLQ